MFFSPINLVQMQVDIWDVAKEYLLIIITKENILWNKNTFQRNEFSFYNDWGYGFSLTLKKIGFNCACTVMIIYITNLLSKGMYIIWSMSKRKRAHHSRSSIHLYKIVDFARTFKCTSSFAQSRTNAYTRSVEHKQESSSGG